MIDFLENKSLLLDTNVLAYMSQESYFKSMTVFLNRLESLQVNLTINAYIKAEFLRGANSQNSKKVKEELLNGLTNLTQLPPERQNLIDEACHLS